MNNNYIVYMHITPNSKRYVGITCKDVKRRWGKNGDGYKNNTHFYNAIKKYGWNNIQHIIISINLTAEEAFELERNLILSYRSNECAHGYNRAVGGVTNTGGYHFSMSKEAKQKISNSKKGVKFSKEHIQGIKNGWILRKQRGNGVAWNKGKKLKDTGMLDNFIQAGKENSKKMRKSVEQIDLDSGEVVNAFESVLAAAHSFNRNYVSSIVDVLKGRRKSAFGYYWKYKN